MPPAETLTETPTVVVEQPTTAPEATWTPLPTDTPLAEPPPEVLPTDTPVDAAAACPDAPQLPVLCANEQILAAVTAGTSNDAPMQLAAAAPACLVADQATGDAMCVAAFGDGWLRQHDQDLGCRHR